MMLQFTVENDIGGKQPNFPTGCADVERNSADELPNAAVVYTLTQLIYTPTIN